MKLVFKSEGTSGNGRRRRHSAGTNNARFPPRPNVSTRSTACNPATSGGSEGEGEEGTAEGVLRRPRFCLVPLV